MQGVRLLITPPIRVICTLVVLRTCKTLTNVKNIVLTIANTRKMMLDSYVCIALFYHSCCY